MNLPPFSKADFASGDGLLIRNDAGAAAHIWQLVESAAAQSIAVAEFAGPADEPFWNSESDYIRALRPYDVRGGVLSIPVKGVLLSSFPYAFGSYATGFDYLIEAVRRGTEDESVEAIAFHIDSPGGHARDCFETAEAIASMLESCGKPSIALCAVAASAAYAIASCADEIVVSKTGLVGSVGVIMSHMEFSKQLEQAGVKVTTISAGKGKDDGGLTAPLSPEAQARMQARVDHLYGMFTAIVAQNRGMEEKAVVAAGALTYYSEGAIQVGFADKEENLSAAMLAFRSTIEGNAGENQMSTQTTTTAATASTVDVDAIRAEAAVAERTRMNAILTSEEAKGRETTALALANQGLTAEAAAAILKTIPLAAAKPAEGQARTTDSAFNAAMASTQNPNVAAEAGKGGKDGKDGTGEQRDHAKAILSAMTEESGIDYTSKK